MANRLRLVPAVVVLILLGACTSQPGVTDPAGQSSSSPTPTVNRQQEAQTGADYADALVECLRSKGFEVTTTTDGGFDVSLGGSSDASFQAADAQCRKDLGPLPAPAPLTVAEIQQLYAFALDERECLIAHGFTPSEPSSEELYIQKYQAMEAPWSPYETVGSPNDVARAYVACPQRFPGDP